MSLNYTINRNMYKTNKLYQFYVFMVFDETGLCIGFCNSKCAEDLVLIEDIKNKVLNQKKKPLTRKQYSNLLKKRKRAVPQYRVS